MLACLVNKIIHCLSNIQKTYLQMKQRFYKVNIVILDCLYSLFLMYISTYSVIRKIMHSVSYDSLSTDEKNNKCFRNELGKKTAICDLSVNKNVINAGLKVDAHFQTRK